MIEQPPSDRADHAEDFAHRSAEIMDYLAGDRMTELGIPTHPIGTRGPGDGHAAFIPQEHSGHPKRHQRDGDRTPSAVGFSWRTRSAWLPDVEDPARAEKANIERLEEVKLSEEKRNLIRIGPGQREAHRRQLPDCRFDHHTACINMRQSSTKDDVRLLGVPV